MKKILNADVTNVVEESLNGYLLAYKKYLLKKLLRRGALGIIIGR